MKRWLAPLAPLALVVGLAASGAGPAAAAKPEPIIVGPGELIAPCPDFDVQLTAKGKLGIIELPGDRLTLIWPKLRVTVTRLDAAGNPTGQSVTYVAPGTNHIQNLANGGQYITATGPNVITVPEVEGPNAHPAGVFFTTGNVSWTLDAAGNEVGGMFSGSGRVTDVCQLLAP